MRTLSRFWTVAGAAACLLITNGCVTGSRGHNVSKIESFPGADRKPSLYIERYEKKIFWNEQAPLVNDFVQKVNSDYTLQKFAKSGLFDRVESINFGADYTIQFEERTDIRVDVTRRSFFLITLGIIPLPDSRTYKLTAYVKNNKTGVMVPVESKETAEFWSGILVLPIAIFDPVAGNENFIHFDLVDNLALAVRNAILKHEQNTVSSPVVKAAVVEAPVIEGGDDGLVKKLKLLKSARESNVLTEQEYQQKRSELLKGL